jgi:hypothetical protein
MDAVTYPQPAVVTFINESIIPVRVRFDAQPLATQFNVQWTPTLVTVGGDGKEHHRTVGFLPPEELIPSLLLGAAKCAFDAGDMAPAVKNLERLLAAYPKAGCAPEAVYLHGVAQFKTAHDPKPLKEAYEKLHTVYPGTEWERRASPYRLL